MALINTSLISDSNDTLAKAQNSRTTTNFVANRYQPAQQQIKISDALNAKLKKYESDFTASRDVVNKRYNDIVRRYGEFYTNGLSYDEKGNPIVGADATSYADRYQFAEFLHDLYPDLSVEYFMKNAEDFMYRATGVKADVKNYWDHLGHIWDSAWANAGNSMAAVMEYFGASLTNKFNTKDWQNTKEERSKKNAVSAANYRKDLGDEKYDSILEKMVSGTWEQWPQMAMMAGLSVLSLVSGGIAGSSGIGGYLATRGISKTATKAAIGRAGKALNFIISGMMDAGSVMTDLTNAGASDETAYAAGLAILLSTGFLETVGDDTLLKPVDKVADSIFKLGDKQVIHQAAKKFSDIVKESFINYGKQIGKAEITETAQEEVEFINEWLAKSIASSYEEKYGRMIDRKELGVTKEQFIDGLKETAIQTLLSTPFMTLGSNVIATGADALFGDIAQQWTPSRYMNKEGATSVINNSTVVTGTVRTNGNIKDADNGKINPVKGHRVGNYFFLDEEVSSKQADYILNGKKAIYAIEPKESKKTTLDVIGLEASAVDSGTTMTAEQADSYLASLELEKKLDTYGYEENGKITDLNYGTARTLYVTLKDTGETIKINIGKESSGNLSGLKDLTGVEYKQFEEEDFTNPEDIKTTKKESAASKKKTEQSKQTQQTETEETDTVVEPDDDDDFDVFANTSQAKTIPNDKEYLEGVKNKVAPESRRKETTAKAFDAKKKTADGYRAETHEYFTEKGDPAKNINEARTVKMVKGDDIQYVRIDNLNSENLRKIIQLADDYGKNPLDLQAKTNYSEKVVKNKNEAMKTAGIEKSSTEPVQRVKDTQVATQSNDSSAEQNTTEQVIKTAPQATVSDTETTATKTQAESQTTETQATKVTEETTTQLETATEKAEAETAEQTIETTEKAEEKTEKAADTVEPVTEKDLDEATDDIQKTTEASRENARGVALLAKGLRDLFATLGHDFDYKKAVNYLNVSTLANAKTLKERVNIFLDLVTEHSYGKELFREIYGEKAKYTKKAKAQFKEEIRNVLYGRKTSLDDNAYAKLEKLIGPTLATVIDKNELTAEEQRLADELKQQTDNKKAKDTTIEKAKEDEAKLTKEEKKKAKEKSKEDVEEAARSKRQRNFKNSAYWLARGAYEYYKKQIDLHSKDEAAKKRFEKAATIYKEWATKLASGDFNDALQFTSTLEAREAERLAETSKDFSYEYTDKKGNKNSKRLSNSKLNYEVLDESETPAEQTTLQREQRKANARAAAIQEAVKAASKYYSENKQVRTVEEMQLLPVTAYQLNKINIALEDKIEKKIDDMVFDIITDLPIWVDTREVLNDKGESVVERIPKSEADIEYVAKLFNTLNAIISEADTDIAQTIESKVQDITLTDPDSREQKAKEALKEIRPLFAYALAVNIEQNIGTYEKLMQDIQDRKFDVAKIQTRLSKIEDHHEWMYNSYFRDSILNISMQDFLARQNGIKKDVIRNQFVGERAVDNLNTRYPIFMENHRKAVELRKRGVPIEEIWEQTGWFWGNDNKWRMEIPDKFELSPDVVSYMEEQFTLLRSENNLPEKSFNEMDSAEKYTLPHRTFKMTDFIGESNILLIAYPKLRGVPVNVYTAKTSNLLGYAENGEINLIVNKFADDADSLRFTFVHELQHIIQDLERFARGGNTKDTEYRMKKAFLDDFKFISSVNNDYFIFNSVLSQLSKFEIFGTKDMLDNELFADMSDGDSFKTLIERNWENVRAKNGMPHYYEGVANYVDIVLDDSSFQEMRKPIKELSTEDIKVLKKRINDALVLEGLISKESTKLTSGEVVSHSAIEIAEQMGYKDGELSRGAISEQSLMEPNRFEEWSGNNSNTKSFYYRLSGEVEARNAAKRYADVTYSVFPYLTADTKNKRQIVIDSRNNVTLWNKDEQLLRYQNSPSSVQYQPNKVDTTSYASSFKYDEATRMYFIDANNVSDEIFEVMSAAQGDAADYDKISQDAMLGAIYLTSLSPKAQDAIVRRSIDKRNQSAGLNGGPSNTENQLRLFFTLDEYDQVFAPNQKGAVLPNSAKILLSGNSDLSTIIHEPYHILWSLDSDFRARAQQEYKAYFEKDPNGDSIRAVYKANSDRFGNFTEDQLVNALKRLTADDFDYLNDVDTDEAIAYMGEAHIEGRDTIEYSKGIKGLMEKAADFIKRVAEKIKKFFGVDILAEANTKIYEPLFDDYAQYKKFVEQAANGEMELSQFDRPQAKTLAISNDGNTRIFQFDRELVLTHAMSGKDLKRKMKVDGQLIMPSMALTNARHIPFYGAVRKGVIFFSSQGMAEDFMSKGWVYDRDLASGRHPEVKEVRNLKSEDLNRFAFNFDIFLDKVFLNKAKDRVLNFTDEDEFISYDDPLELQEIEENKKAHTYVNSDLFPYIGDVDTSQFSLEEIMNSRETISEELWDRIYHTDANNLWEMRQELSSVYDYLADVNIIPKEQDRNAGFNTLMSQLEFPQVDSKLIIAENGEEYTPENILNFMKDRGRITTQKPSDFRYDPADMNYLLGYYLSAVNLFSLEEAHRNEWKFNFSDDYVGIANDILNTQEWADASHSWDTVIRLGIDGLVDNYINEYNGIFWNDVYEKLKLEVLNRVADWLRESAYPNMRDFGKLKDKILELEYYDTVGQSWNNRIGLAHFPEKRVTLSDSAVNDLIDDIRNALDISSRIFTEYGEAKPERIVNIREMSLGLAFKGASKRLIATLKDKYGVEIVSVDELVEKGILSEKDADDPVAIHGALERLAASVKGTAEQIRFQTMAAALNEIRADSKSGEEKKQKVTQYEELVYKYVTNPQVDTLKTVDEWREENKGFFADKDSISSLRTKLENNGLFHNVDIQAELTAEMKDEIKDSVTKRIAYSSEDYKAWGEKLGKDAETINNREVNLNKALFDLYGYREVTINGKKVIKPVGLLSKIFSNVKRSGGADWVQDVVEELAARRNQMLKNGELVITDYEAAHNSRPLRGEVLHALLNKDNWHATDTKNNRTILKGTKGYNSLVFNLEGLDLSAADIENFLKVLTVKSGNNYVPFAAQEGVEGFGMALHGPLITLLNFAHVSDDIKKNKFQADSLYNTDEDFLKAAYNNMRGYAGVSIDSSIYLLDKSERDLIHAIMQLKKDGLLNSIYGLDITQEEFKRDLLGSIDDMVEDVQKKQSRVETLKNALNIDSYDSVAKFIYDIQNALNAQSRIINKVVGKGGLSESEVNKLKKQLSESNARIEELEKNYNEAVKKGVESSVDKELLRLKAENANLDIKLEEALKKASEAKKKANKGVGSFFSKKLHLTEEQIQNIGEDTTKFLEAYTNEINRLNNTINGYKSAKSTANSKVAELENRLAKELNIADSMMKDFNDANVLPLFENTKKAMRHLVSTATSDVQQKLDVLMEGILPPIRPESYRTLDVRKALDFKNIFKAGVAIDEAADNYLEYRKHAQQLIDWLGENMLTKSEVKGMPFVSTTVNQLSARQLVELNNLISQVVSDSKKYYKEANEKENKYHRDWRKNIVEEFRSYAESVGIDLTELGEDDSIGTAETSHKGVGSLLNRLLEDFRIQSAKYRNNYPTLYAYLFGGIDHEGNLWEGLNGAQNGLIEQVQKRTEEVNKIIISEFSNSKFYNGTLTEKNLASEINSVKNGFKTQLSEEEFTEEDREATGLKIEKFKKGKKSFGYAVSIDEDSDSAMKEVARWLGNIEKERTELQDKLDGYRAKYDSVQNNLATAQIAHDNIMEADDASQDLLKETQDALEKAQKAADKLDTDMTNAETRLVQLETIGRRPNANTANYTTQELLGIYLIAKQKGGIDHLVFAPRFYTEENQGIAGSSVTNNLSIGNIISVIKMVEEDPQFAPLLHMAKKIHEIVSDRFEEVRDTRFFISKGTDYIESVDEYFGFFVEEGDFMYGPDLDTDLGIAKAEGAVNANAKVGDSMTKKRRGEYGLNLRAFDTAKTQIYRQEYYINFGKKLENIKDLIKDESFQSSLKIAEGREAGREDLKQLQKFAEALGSSAKNISEDAMADITRDITNNTAAAAMMFRATTVLIQLPTLLVSMREKHIGIKGVLKGMARAFSDNSINELSPQMRDRMNGYIKSIKESRNLGSLLKSQSLEKIINKTQSIGLKGLEIVDNYVAEAMWYAYYEGVREEYTEAKMDVGLSKEDFDTLCANEATQRVMDITPVQQAKDNAYMYNNKNAYLRSLLMFTNQSTKMLNMFINDADDISHHKGDSIYVRRLFKTIGVALMISLLNGAIKGTLFKRTKDDDDDSAEIHLLSNTFVSLLEGMTDYIPMWDMIFPSSYSESTILTDVANFGKVLFKDADDRTEHQMANACAYLIRDAMNVSGFPGSEAMAIYRGFINADPYFNAGYLYNNTIGDLVKGDD